MKGQGKWKKNKRGKNGSGQLQKYMVTVDEFVRSQGGSAEAEDDPRLRYVKKKSRKELRKEKRKMKKAKMKSYYEGNKNPSLPIDQDAKSGTIPSEVKQQQKKKKLKEKIEKDSLTAPQAKSSQPTKVKPEQTKTLPANNKGKKKNKLQESRKKALLEANEAEDREIKKLEKCLGYNKRKNKKTLPQSFAADGLDYILGILGSGSSATEMYDSDDDMDMAKEKFKKLDESDSEMSEDEDNSEQGEGEGDEDDSEDGSDEEDEVEMEGEDDDDDDGPADGNDTGEEEMEEEEDEDSDAASDRESEGDEEADTQPSLKPSGSSAETAISAVGKYVPPHLRDTGDDKRKAELVKLKKNVKGLLNRLSEANMASISGQLEELYMSSSRKDMSDTLTELLLAACVTPSLMPDRLLREHVLLLSVLHHTVGLEVGAHFLETVVRQFHELHGGPGEGRECDNLLAMVCHLYNFQVVHSLLIFDLLRLLVGAFSERDIELALAVLRNVGFGLRKDDPLALKELIADAQRKASDLGSKFQDQTRVRFMLETMLALKNNDMRKIPGYDPEPVEKLKKLQRTLTHQSASGSDLKLRVSLENLLEAEQVGRWWIVGSSWSGRPMISDPGSKIAPQATGSEQFSAKVLDLARKQRMNTEVRRNIFCVIMTSEDYLDAFEKLLRMGLKDQQEREIVRVLLDCCLQEKSFNAFYAVLGQKFCSHDRRFQMTFQFSLWDKFKELENLPSHTTTNLTQLLCHLLHSKSLPLSVLKVIEFGELDKPKVRFLRQLLTKLLKETEPEDLEGIFGRISGIPKLGMLREGMKLFISHFLLRNAKSQGPAEQAALLSERAQIATKAMEAKEAKLRL